MAYLQRETIGWCADASSISAKAEKKKWKPEATARSTVAVSRTDPAWCWGAVNTELQPGTATRDDLVNDAVQGFANAANRPTEWTSCKWLVRNRKMDVEEQ